MQFAAGKKSCNTIALKRCTNTETRWNRKLVSLISPVLRHPLASLVQMASRGVENNVRPPDIVVGGLRFHCDLLILFVSYLPSSLCGTQPKPATCLDVSAIWKCIENACPKSGVYPPLKIGSPKTTFYRKRRNITIGVGTGGAGGARAPWLFVWGAQYYRAPPLLKNAAPSLS